MSGTQLCALLKENSQKNAFFQQRDAFAYLFPCWCHNPVATFSFCLLAQTFALVKKFTELKVSIGFLM